MTIYINLNRIQQRRQLSFPETDIQNRTRYLHYLAYMFLSHIQISLLSTLWHVLPKNDAYHPRTDTRGAVYPADQGSSAPATISVIS